MSPLSTEKSSLLDAFQKHVDVGFSKGKVTHEHIYWDQASVLVQCGLLNSAGIPVKGVETAKKMDELRHRLLKE